MRASRLHLALGALLGCGGLVLADAPAAWGQDATPPPLRSPSAEGRAAALYDEALALAVSGRESAAAEKLERALAIAAQYREARAALAVLLAREGRSAEAIALLAEGRRLAPRHAPYAILEARLRSDRGEDGAALALLEPLPAAAMTTSARALHAALCQREERYLDASRTYRELLQGDPRRGLWWLGLALAEEGRARPSEALGAYRNAQRAADLGEEPAAFVERRIAALESLAAAPASTAEAP